MQRKGITMRKYIVKVNGSVYEVEVEELTAGEAAQYAAAPEKPAPAKAEEKPAEATAPAAQPSAKPAAAGAKSINAPMPGSIISVSVKPGDTFRSGQVLLVLEAMKMENEIMAPHDGRVISVNVSAGSSVNSGDVLISYE